MSRLIATLGLDARGPSITIRNGDASTLIKEELALQKADLVVMGTHARSGIAHALIGSVAEPVLGSTTCDMLVVPVPEPRWSSAHQDLT
ncbi:MAG: universal stress protein [Reyranella sp.]|nr:universal stress protein [Reyranella sp.]